MFQGEGAFMTTTSTTNLTSPGHHNTRLQLRGVAMMIVVVCENLKAQGGKGLVRSNLS